MAEGVYSYDGEGASPAPAPPRPSEPLRTVFVPIMQVSIDPWALVSEKFDLASYVKAPIVCRKWRSMCLFSSVGMRILDNEVETALALLESMAKRCKSLPAFHADEPCDTQISEFVKDTVSDAKIYLRRVAANSSELSSNNHFLLLFDLFTSHLRYAEDYLSTATELSEEADVAEIRLKRALLQLETIFPLQSAYTSASDPKKLKIIRDRHARAAWEGVLRNRAAPWVRLVDAERALRFPLPLLPHLRPVLDFPTDSIITVFKWNMFTSAFGPWNQLKQNFERFVVRGKHFFGFINRSHAEHLLLDNPPKSVLLRSSRTHPSLIAISYRPAEGPVIHITNNRNFWTMPDFSEPLRKISAEKGKISHASPVPLNYFIELFEQSGYKLLSTSPPDQYTSNMSQMTQSSESSISSSPVASSSFSFSFSSSQSDSLHSSESSFTSSSYVNDGAESSNSSSSYWSATSSGSTPAPSKPHGGAYVAINYVEGESSTTSKLPAVNPASRGYSGGYD